MAALAFALRFKADSEPAGNDDGIFDFDDEDGDGGSSGGSSGGRGSGRGGSRYTGSDGESLPKVKGGGVIYIGDAAVTTAAAAAAAAAADAAAKDKGTAGTGKGGEGEEAMSGGDRARSRRAAAVAEGGGRSDAAGGLGGASLRRRWRQELGLSPSMVLDAKVRSCDLLGSAVMGSTEGEDLFPSLRCWESGLEVFRDSALMHNERGNLLVQLGDLVEAAKAYESAFFHGNTFIRSCSRGWA